MADETTASAANLDQFAMMTSKIERESRFTRSLVVICTVANIAVSVYGLIQMSEGLPPLVLAQVMDHMSELVYQSKAIAEKTSGVMGGAKKAPAPPAGK
jgi:hypothetical protein